MQITKFCCRQAFRSSPAVLKFQARTVGLNYRRNEMYQKALLCVLPATDRHARDLQSVRWPDPGDWSTAYTCNGDYLIASCLYVRCGCLIYLPRRYVNDIRAWVAAREVLVLRWRSAPPLAVWVIALQQDMATEVGGRRVADSRQHRSRWKEVQLCGCLARWWFILMHWLRRLGTYCSGYNYDSTSIRRLFDCLSKVIKVTVT